MAVAFRGIFALPAFEFLFLAWFRLATPTYRGVGVFGATAFSLIETFWTYLFAPDGIPGHTTWAQWFANLLYAPILLLWYPALLPGASSAARILRVALYPLNVWLLEIVEGYGLMALFGRNVAWTYEGLPDALFHGNIRLAYAVPWIGMGYALEYLGFNDIVFAAGERLGQEITPAFVFGALAVAIISHNIRIGWPKLVL